MVNQNKLTINTIKVCLVVSLLFSSLVITTFITNSNKLIIHSDNLNAQSTQEFNPYFGADCTKLGEFDSNFGFPHNLQYSSINSRNYVFIDESQGVLILDITDPANPEVTNFFLEQESISSIFVNDHLLYISGLFNELMIYDVSNVVEPVQLFKGDSDDFDVLSRMIVQDNYLYGTDGDDGLVIIDVSNLEDPQFISRYEEGIYFTQFNDLFVEGNRVFTILDSSIKIIDVTNKSNPILNCTYSNSNFISLMFLEYQDNYLYICTFNGRFFILDITNTSSPDIVGSFWDGTKYFYDLQIDGGICYLLDTYSGVHILNVTNPSKIDLLHLIKTNGYYNYLSVIQGYVYTLSYLGGLEIYSLSNEFEPSLVGRFFDGGTAYAVEKKGDFAFVANYFNGIEIYRLKRSITPELKARIVSGRGYRDIFINNKLAYAFSSSHFELLTIDISRPIKPKIVSNQNLLLEINNTVFLPSFVEIFDYTAFIEYRAGGYSYLAIMDLSNESSYQLKEFIYFEDYLTSVTFDGYYLYVASYDGICYVMSYDGDDYSFLSTIPIMDDIYDLHLYGDYLFIATTTNFGILDISDPSSPNARSVFHGMANEWDGYRKVVVESDIAYLIGENYNEIQFVNVEDIDEPELEGAFRCNETILDLIVDNKFVYVSSDDVNLEVLKLDRFINSLVKIVTPIVATIIIIGVPIIMVVYHSKRKPETIEELAVEEPIVQKFPDPEEIDIDVEPEDFDDPKLYEYAQEIFENYDDE